MRREELTALFAAYERDHPVETYEAYGHAQWPMLRVLLGLAAHGETRAFKSGGVIEPTVGPQRRVLNRVTSIGRTAGGLLTDRLIDALGAITPERLARAAPRTPLRGPRDVVLMVRSNRVVEYEGRQIHRIVDPLVDALQARGLRYDIWETGLRVPRRYHPPVSISERLEREAWVAHRLGVVERALPQPDWFGELSTWARRALEVEMRWPTVNRLARQVALHARVVERWLRRVRCRLLLLDCWYSMPHLAASLAASRLGITSVDVQHGMQGIGHFGYAHWTRAPEGGYGVFPQRFWVWGPDDLQSHQQTNGQILSPDRLVVGGHPWLNQWRQPDSKRYEAATTRVQGVVAGAGKVVLVTLQRDLAYEELLAQIIAQSPPDWQWLIRMRQNMVERADALAQTLGQTGHPRINITDATQLPLYALLRASDLHVTWFSTCALEALAFDVPSVLLHPSGLAAFEPYVDQQVMQYAPSAQAFGDAAKAVMSVESARLAAASEQIFAPVGSARSALDRLLHDLHS